MGNRLIEYRQPVTHRTFGCLRNEAQGFGFGVHALFLADFREMFGEQFGRYALQVEPLAARQHCNRNLVHLGRCEQEFHVRWRLFKRFQQRIEGIFRQHVNFVDNVDFVACRHGCIADRLDNLADIVDAGVARRVHLYHVDMPTFGNRAAWFANTARIDGWATLPVWTNAVQRLCNQSRGRCLADSAHASHQECMGKATTLDCVAECLHHRILADQFGKILRTIFTCQHAIR